MTTEPFSHLHELGLVVKRILQRFRLTDQECREPLYRYIEFGVFRSMVKAQEEKSEAERGLDLWMMDAETMNDPLEGRYLIERSKNAAKDSDGRSLYELFKSSEEYPVPQPMFTFISSFTREVDDLNLWRNYCQGHGVSLQHMPNPDAAFYNVVYGKRQADEVLAEFGWILQRIVKFKNEVLWSRAVALTMPILYLVKAEGHQSEREVRLIEPREGWDGLKIVHTKLDAQVAGRLYIVKNSFFFRESTPSAEVMLGPLADTYQYLQGANVFFKEVQFNLVQIGLRDVTVTQSRHDLRY